MSSATPSEYDSPLVFGGTDDLETATLLGNRLLAEPDRPVTAVFFDEAVAEIFRDVPGVGSLAWGPQLARRIVEETPPSPLSAVAPPPIVVGDAPIARLVAVAWVRDWVEPGQRFPVHCIGSDGAWAREAKEDTKRDGRITWAASPMRPEPVLGRVAELVARWVPPNHGTPAGPAVVVATEDEAMTVAIAVAISRRVPGSRVAAVVSGDTFWPAIPGVRLYPLSDALAAEAARRRDPVAELARLILAESAWLDAPDAKATAPEARLFGKFAYDGDLPVGWEDQPEAARDAVVRVAESCEQILAAGGVELADAPASGGPSIILDPGELTAMARAILRMLGLEPDARRRLTALELANRLPVFAKRAGLLPVRPAGYEQLLDYDMVGAMALRVHLVYSNISAETDNATGSPLAGALWSELADFEKASNRAAVTGSSVAHAALGLEWRRADRSALPDIDDAVERLAELEHRRWAINQRRNGRRDHKWAIPWDEITDDNTKEYDRGIVRAMPEILRLANIEVVRPG